MKGFAKSLVLKQRHKGTRKWLIAHSCFLEPSFAEFDTGLAGYAGGMIKLRDDKGVLTLGKLSQKYIDDPDLRGILANAELDANKMKSFAESDKLLVITSVIYSETFDLKGERMHQVKY